MPQELKFAAALAVLISPIYVFQLWLNHWVLGSSKLFSDAMFVFLILTCLSAYFGLTRIRSKIGEAGVDEELGSWRSSIVFAFKAAAWPVFARD